MAESQNEGLVRRFFDKLNAEDLEGLRTLLHPQATWKPMAKSDIPGAGVHTGHKGIIDEFLKPVRGLFEGKDPQNSIQTLFSKGDQVVAETHGTGRFKNGKTYDNRYCWVCRFAGDQVGDAIVEVRAYLDSAMVAWAVTRNERR